MKELNIISGKEPNLSAVFRWDTGYEVLVLQSVDKAKRFAIGCGAKFSDQRRKKRKRPSVTLRTIHPLT